MTKALAKQPSRTRRRPAPGAEQIRQSALPLADGPVVVDGLRFRRGDSVFRVQGVTYGPFAPDIDGTQFPDPRRITEDFRQMAAGGINAIRVYHPPPQRLLGAAEANGLQVLIDIPWSKHLCFLNSPAAQREARESIRSAISAGQAEASVLAYSIGNEIPADVVRWHGARNIERFLRELADLAKQTDPQRLITYANFPPTEYLDVSFADFVTFNVYLHDREVFRRYLRRLQNLVGDKPLLLGELGMDTSRYGELGQAEFLEGHLSEVFVSGLAGAFVFAWTDDWFTGGHQITDWAFGITDAARLPKAGYHATSEVFDSSPTKLLESSPKVSVVVCSYNGGRTLAQCLQSLAKLDYPDYEVIVVDDGSTDDTGQILDRFPEVRAIRQSNEGLSAARNVGLQQASGSIVAYTDSDCFVDPDWLTLLVDQLQRTGAAAVGGPNLTPDDGWLASCVSASPGQPTHVLHNDQEAEHIPGCNMAFRRESLLAINGFDPVYRTAGDDVDVCWRLQHDGEWITFAPGAFVWHHRRQGPSAYFRQQAGYGAAEALLYSKHPEKFNGRGEGKWQGVLYGASLQGLCVGKAIIYRGTYATGMFQCLYQPAPAHWAMLPGTLEWHATVLLVLLVGLLWPPLLLVAGGMLLLSLLVAGLQALQARVPRKYDGLLSRLVVAALCYAQPLVRSWARYRGAAARPNVWDNEQPVPNPRPTPIAWHGCGEMSYWTEEYRDRTELLAGVVQRLDKLRWPKMTDAGWSDGDLEIWRHSWSAVQICTTQEEHGGNKRLIRVRYRLRMRGIAKAAIIAAGFILLGLAANAQFALAIAWGLLLFGGAAIMWSRCRWIARNVLQLVEDAADELRLIRYRSSSAERSAAPESA